ncbi:MAG TPA: chemotaxis protein CheX [Solimonas sp.]|nr:chemotaxis protein CheX [Solimonas sp.]
MTENDLKVFVDAVTHYFSHLTREPATIRAAYLADGGAAPVLQYTGRIDVSGRLRGSVHFSARRPMLFDLLREAQEPDTSEDNLLDAVGEIANTIAGNARRHFGSALDISVPVTANGAGVTNGVRARPFVIQLRWGGHDGLVVVDLEATAG